MRRDPSEAWASVAGTQLKVSVRGKESPAEVFKMPFVPNTYFKEPTAAS